MKVGVGENSLELQLEEEAQQYILESEREKNVAQALMCKVENEKNVSCKPNVKVKAFEPPKFCGNISDYSNLKKLFPKSSAWYKPLCSENVPEWSRTSDD